MIVSIFVGVLMPITCVLLYPNFNLQEQAMSHFGVHENTQGIFLVSIILISFGVYINNSERIKSTFTSKPSRWLHIPLSISMLSLLMVGVFDMGNFLWLHNIAAGIFFLSYAIFVSLFGIFDIKYNLRRGVVSLIFSFLMFSATILIGLFSGLSPFEFTFMFLMIVWNIFALPYNRFKNIS